MKATVCFVGSSLLAPLKQAEQDIRRQYKVPLELVTYNFGAPFTNDEWADIERSVAISNIVFVIHVMDGENASRLMATLDQQRRQQAIIVINCMPDLMRRTRMGRLQLERFGKRSRRTDNDKEETRGLSWLSAASSWVGRQTRREKTATRNSHTQYLKFVDKLPGILKFVPSAGALRDVKNYLNIFCYFLQPTPANIRSMFLYALKEYVPDDRWVQVEMDVPPPERAPSVAIYHPDATTLFENFADYQEWYESARSRSLDSSTTIGLLLMRPQVISGGTKHYDRLIRAIEAEQLSVIPALATLMDNREAVAKFFKDQRRKTKDHKTETAEVETSRVSQIVSLTGFSFVGGPAMNDSEAAADFLTKLNRPYRSAVSLDTQTIDSWTASQIGLNPVQSGMQIAIPEIDGATEPFIYGGIRERGIEPVALEERCIRFARRISRWNRLRTAPRNDVKLALTLFCFPPNKGNIGTAADLDVFPGLLETLQALEKEGYQVNVPSSADELRKLISEGNSANFGSLANVAYRMSVGEYRRLCPYVDEAESEWGAAPGKVNAFGDELLIQGVQLGNILIGVQPTFGYEGDPMRLMMARSGGPHHGFLAFYTYLSKVLNVDAVVHVGTHGALEFMPGKQVGLSEECWPDRLIGELPNIYIYSVNNPSEGSIAKRRSYAELISYLTPPIENAGLYRELAALKDLVMSYRQSTNEGERDQLYEAIQASSLKLNMQAAAEATYGELTPV